MSSGPIYRHGDAKSGEVASGDGDAHAAIVARMERELDGKVDHVFHEIVSDLVHIDVHMLVKPDATVLFTTGMSDRRMTVPKGAPSSGFAELCVMLPPDWKLDAASFRDERWYWPVRWLKVLARLPHQHATWLGHGHTIPNGEPAKPFAEGTLLSGVCLMSLFDDREQAVKIDVNTDKTVQLFELSPFTMAEMDLKLKTSAPNVFRGFGKAGVARIVRHDRACTVTGQKPAVGFMKRLFGG